MRDLKSKQLKVVEEALPFGGFFNKGKSINEVRSPFFGVNEQLI